MVKPGNKAEGGIFPESNSFQDRGILTVDEG